MKDRLLDSNLIVDTKGKLISKQIYDKKVVICGNYIQVYTLENHKLKVDSINNKKELDLIKVENKKQKTSNAIDGAKIETKNITRSKLECQRLAKTNYECWKTFITLTFADNVKDIKEANKRFRHFINKIHRIEYDFKYLGVIEFQKRGAVHYHLFTNININDKRFIFEQENNPKFKHIKYWVDGFTKVQSVEEDIKKIVGYISKYMTKDIDNRLFNSHRYFYSRNLDKPKSIFIDSLNIDDQEYFQKLVLDKKIIYESEYLNKYNEEKIAFKEYL